jgi:hypothetical protein
MNNFLKKIKVPGRHPSFIKEGIDWMAQKHFILGSFFFSDECFSSVTKYKNVV